MSRESEIEFINKMFSHYFGLLLRGQGITDPDCTVEIDDALRSLTKLLNEIETIDARLSKLERESVKRWDAVLWEST